MLARKLLDIGDPKTAYLVMRDAVEPIKENSRVERQFMAGWIALRFLNEPAIAARHFARIQEVSIHPTSLGRAHYWLGRAAEAANSPTRRARNIRQRQARRPPITASSRAPALGLQRASARAAADHSR